ncbi:MAG: hypothetical protein LBS55_05485, partial [Prevotellaceae bacterium]|nr:hypothetical protein [Prevotellaceae bacterium]
MNRMNKDKLLRTLGNIGRNDLNYGRHIIKSFLSKAMLYSTVLDLGAGKGDDLFMAKSVYMCNLGGGRRPPPTTTER